MKEAQVNDYAIKIVFQPINSCVRHVIALRNTNCLFMLLGNGFVCVNCVTKFVPGAKGPKCECHIGTAILYILGNIVYIIQNRVITYIKQAMYYVQHNVTKNICVAHNK